MYKLTELKNINLRFDSNTVHYDKRISLGQSVLTDAVRKILKSVSRNGRTQIVQNLVRKDRLYCLFWRNRLGKKQFMQFISRSEEQPYIVSAF